MKNNLKILAVVLPLVSLAVVFRACTKDETSENVSPFTNEDVVSHPNLKSENERERILSMKKEAREQEHNNLMEKKWQTAFATPINFWGKVVDQDGNPIQGARIEINLLDDRTQHPNKINNRKHTKISDANGLFELLRKKGATLYAKASKEEYSGLKGKTGEGDLSRREIYYALDEALPRYQPPTKRDPAIFVLRKKKSIAKLGHFRNGISLSKDGEAHTVRLGDKGKSMEIEARCWSGAPVPFAYGKYDWRAEIRILGATLKPITEITPVEAPVDGYQALHKIDMNTGLGPNEWSSSNFRPRDFWVKFDDGAYAKVSIKVRTGRKHEVNAKVWFNLDGTNNFEQ